MQFPFMETVRRQLAPHFYLLSFIALTLSGCSFGFGGSGSRTPTAETPPALSSAPAATQNDSWFPSFSLSKTEPSTNPQYVTEEDLLKIETEFQRVSGKDSYRFSIPKDVTGANVCKATLTRLQDYEAKHPGAYPELIAFTRARAYEGLQEYVKAQDQYQLVSQTKHQLREEAASAVETLARFQELHQRTPASTTPLDYLKSLDEQIKSWQELANQYAGTRYQALAREEEERLDQAKVAFLMIIAIALRMAMKVSCSGIVN
jgi:hypothetical protein